MPYERRTFAVPAALTRPLTFLGVETRMLTLLALPAFVLAATGQWLAAATWSAIGYAAGRLATSSDPQFIQVLLAASRMDCKLHDPDKFDAASRDAAFRLVD